MSFIDYLTELRMKEAKKLISEGRMKVRDVGAAVGYPNTKYFIRLFKKATGETPTQYRDHNLR